MYDPRPAQGLQRFILMDGEVLTWGDVIPAVSANLYDDPDAAQEFKRMRMYLSAERVGG